MENQIAPGYPNNNYISNNNNSNNTDSSGKGLLAFVLVVIAIGLMFILSPWGQTFIYNKKNTFKVRVEVEKTFEADTYWSGETVTFDLDKPIMKCKIISIERNSYQKNHIVDYEHSVGDIIYITELHGESYSQLTQIDLTLREDEILGGQYENVTKSKAFEIARLEDPGQSNLTKGNKPRAEEESAENQSVSISTEETESYIHDYKDMVPADQEEQIQELLKEKYEETGFKVYIIFFDTNDKSYIEDYSSSLINAEKSTGVVYCRNANDNSWYVRWSVPQSKSDYFSNNYTRIGDAYLVNGNYVDRVRNIADTAYTVYQECE